MIKKLTVKVEFADEPERTVEREMSKENFITISGFAPNMINDPDFKKAVWVRGSVKTTVTAQ